MENRFLADGRKRMEKAYPVSRERVFKICQQQATREIAAEYAEMLQKAGCWKRLCLRRKMKNEIKRRAETLQTKWIATHPGKCAPETSGEALF